jgi:hypothetical protein
VFPFQSPPGLRWDSQASDFLDLLVESNIGYIDVQESIERLVLAGLHEEITVGFEVDGFNIRLHRTPILFPGMRALHVFTTVTANGLIDVFHICLADRRAQRRD